MKKFIIACVMFLFGCLNVEATYMNVGTIEISKDRTKYYLMSAEAKRASLADKQKFVFDEKNAAHYNKKIEEFLKPYYSSAIYDGYMDDDGKYNGKASLVPGELLTERVFQLGGSSGSCKLVNHEIDCSVRDIPSEWTEAQQINTTYLKEAYPLLLDGLVAITRPDTFEPISFQKKLTYTNNFPNNILDNGNLDSEGRWVANNPIKIYESEYEEGRVVLLVKEFNPFGLANIFFSKDATTYRETHTTNSVYNESILTKSCEDAEDYDNCIKWNKMLNYDALKGVLETVPIDKKNNVIHGIWFTIFNGGTQNKALEKGKSANGTRSFAGIYEFEIPIEVIPDSEKTAGKHTVLFDQYNGYGLPCDGGICSESVESGSKVKFPVTSKTNMKNGVVVYHESYGKLIGWDNQFDDNGEPYCQGGDDENVATSIKKGDETPEITSDTTYKACYKEVINGYRYLAKGAIADGLGDVQCGTKYWIDYCTLEGHDNLEQFCYYIDPNDGKTLRKVYRKQLAISLEMAGCTSDQVEEPKKEELDDISNLTECPKISNNNKLTVGTNVVKYCYKKDNADILNEFKCPSGYTMKNISNADGSDNCNDKTKICINNFNITCSKGENAKPRIAVSSVIAENGYGDIKVTATAQEGVIQDYFVSPYYVTPIDRDEGWVSLNGKTSFIYNSPPGVLFFWVRDSRGNISNAVSGAVFDTKNTDTTVKDFSLVDDNGNYQAPTRVSYNMDGVKDSNYVMMSNNLNKDSKVLADGFNPFDMQYELEVDSSTITVYATLTSTDSSYVPGYEPRTVNLSYGMNTILIKIQNNKGITRTYTILVNRKDTRTSDNTLSDISLSEGNITFNSNVTDYKVEIPKSTTSVNVNSTIASDKASYVSGYEPGNVSITGDTTVKLIKVKSETGSTRTYVITFVKEGTDVISKESLQLSDLVIPDAYIPFESDVSNYSLSVAYETDSIDINTVKKDKNSSVLIRAKKKNDSDYKVVSDIGLGLDVGENFIEISVKDIDGEVSYYRLTVIRKEFGLGISNDTGLKELRVLGYDIDFEPNKKEYTVRIKQEKTLVVTAVPASNRAEVFIRGNEELTGFSTVRVKVVAENGEFETYSIDIKKDAFNKTIEIAAIVAGVVIILASSAIIIVKKKSKAKREYFEE